MLLSPLHPPLTLLFLAYLKYAVALLPHAAYLHPLF